MKQRSRATVTLLLLAASSLYGCGSDGLIELDRNGDVDAGGADAMADRQDDAAQSCADQGSCSPLAPYCHPQSHLCVECLTSTNCEEAVCNSTTGRCVECVTPADCSEEQQTCDTARGICVGCLDSTACMEPSDACNTATGKCEETCAEHAQCSDSERMCNPTTGFCVDCLTSNDCESGQVCDSLFHECNGR